MDRGARVKGNNIVQKYYFREINDTISKSSKSQNFLSIFFLTNLQRLLWFFAPMYDVDY